MGAEKRKQRRLKGKEGALAAFSATQRSGFTVMGQILDISKGGLALRYLDLGDHSLDYSSEIEIFGCRDPIVHIEGIPCNIVYDIREEADEFVMSLRTTTRRCGVRFGELTNGQSRQLESMLQNYTSREV